MARARSARSAAPVRWAVRREVAREVDAFADDAAGRGRLGGAVFGGDDCDVGEEETRFRTALVNPAIEVRDRQAFAEDSTRCDASIAPGSTSSHATRPRRCWRARHTAALAIRRSRSAPISARAPAPMKTMRFAVQPLAMTGAVNDSSGRGVNSPRASATPRLLPTAASNSATTRRRHVLPLPAPRPHRRQPTGRECSET